MRYLHTMVRVKDLAQSLHFYCDLLGLTKVDQHDSEQGKFSLIFLAARDNKDASAKEPAT